MGGGGVGMGEKARGFAVGRGGEDERRGSDCWRRRRRRKTLREQQERIYTQREEVPLTLCLRPGK